jgi:2-dehydro-3-deoxyglucarate aldolase
MNKLKQALKNDKITLGTWIQIGHPACAEILANAGFDWICVDLEHGIISLESMASLFRAIERYDCVPVARVPANDPVWIHRTLDAGAGGLIIPMVNSKDEAEKAIAESKYPPLGRRGFGYSRANSYGANFDGYKKQANDDIAIILQVEHIDAVRNIDEILSLKGLDGTFIGPLDLAGSMGAIDNLEDPSFKSSLRTYLDACKKYRKPAGMHIVRPDVSNIKKAVKDGYKMIALGLDVVFLEEKSRELLTGVAELIQKN